MFLTLTMLAASYLGSLDAAADSGGGGVISTASEGVIIGGWVVMWRPINVLLYDWWLIRHTMRLFRQLSQGNVRVAPR